MFGLGMPELIVILIVALLVFGGKRLPEIGKGIGEAIRGFKKATSEPDQIDVTPGKKTGAEEDKGGEQKGKSE